MLMNNAGAGAVDVVAERVATSGRRLSGAVFAAGLISIGLAASQASALEGIDLSTAAEPVAEGECPRLIQIKYPFLSCAAGEIGLSTADEDWDNSRRIPTMSDWTENDQIISGPS